VDPWLVGDLKPRPASVGEHAPHLADVAERDRGVRDVLEHHVRKADGGARVVDAAQRFTIALEPAHVVQARVVVAGESEHLLGDVQRVDMCRTPGELACEPSDAAADLHDAVGRVDVDLEHLADGVHDLRALGPEPFLVGAAVLQVVVDEEERVLAGALVPEALHILAAHRDRASYRDG
jgi:hypothetical protein